MTRSFSRNVGLEKGNILGIFFLNYSIIYLSYLPEYLTSTNGEADHGKMPKHFNPEIRLKILALYINDLPEYLTLPVPISDEEKN